MSLLGLVAVLAYLYWYEVNRIRRFDGKRGEEWAFAVAMLIAAAYACALLLDVPLPNPTTIIQGWLGGIGEWILPSQS